jgi:hypothetical protein
MILPFRRLPLLFFGTFAVLVALTAQIGQRVYDGLDYDPHLFTVIGYFCVVGIGLARSQRWAWWVGVLLWPFQLFTITVFVVTMSIGLPSGGPTSNIRRRRAGGAEPFDRVYPGRARAGVTAYGRVIGASGGGRPLRSEVKA